ncbi:hypothetical protein HUT06_21205 [Actinomadura sp. NAK00032]|uniref:hypothetical protein n=1 Tax=Actinomadura sp. NAK00032 TaxID=2742128 RepID=UPI001590475C|nr:hypothetical protein [Actinomadura sp. NAK00032]QKW32612.1 hypothetical protein HUT06_21205 [Actinomadura sp. NAK00032]
MIEIVANLDLPGSLSLSLMPRMTQPVRDLLTQVGISSMEGRTHVTGKTPGGKQR